jgi:hypothetical protein
MCVVWATSMFAISAFYMAKAMSKPDDPFYLIAAPIVGLTGLVWAILARRAYRFRSESGSH